MKEIVVLYHAKCFDGLGAAWSAKQALGDRAEYHAASYQDKWDFSYFKDKLVYLLDFSMKRKEFLLLKEQAKAVMVLDHHKTAEEEIGDLVVIDQTKSGAILAWKHFHPGKEAPFYLKLIQDRDLWKWKFDETLHFTSALGAFGFELDTFEETMKKPLEELLELGKIEAEKLQTEMEEAAKVKHLVEFMGYEVYACVGSPKISSNLGNHLAKGMPFGIVYYDKEDIRIVSLRSTDDGEDVSAIAKQIEGGGGHRNAAGCSFNLSDKEKYWKDLA